ncbi:MAG TPA: LysR substrate-binding domain-containing protein, partial [Burkholderiaceae bacterium]|nr:LysR substrate-binding domain-containing protein [Burkholderiaceae bacterium]
RVAALEDLIGSPVFVRGKTLALTVAGLDYLQRVQPALGLLAEVPQHRRARQRQQKLRVGAPPTFARQVLVPALEAFTAAHPDVDLELVLTLPALDVEATDADVEVRYGDPSLGHLLLRDRVQPMASPTLLGRLPPLRTPADLRAAPLLRTPLELWTPWLRAAGLDWPEPAAGPQLMDLGMALEAAVCGQGVVLGRPALARHWLASGSLVPLFDLSVEPANCYYLLPFSASGAAPLFAHWLIERCAALQAQAHAGNSGPG